MYAPEWIYSILFSTHTSAVRGGQHLGGHHAIAPVNMHRVHAHIRCTETRNACVCVCARARALAGIVTLRGQPVPCRDVYLCVCVCVFVRSARWTDSQNVSRLCDFRKSVACASVYVSVCASDVRAGHNYRTEISSNSKKRCGRLREEVAGAAIRSHHPHCASALQRIHNFLPITS